MPELPEVETVCRALAPSLVGNQIRTVVIRHTQLRWPIASKLSELSNEPMVSLQRRAKYLLLQLSQGWLIIHLGMSGTLRLLPAKTAVNKHDHIDLQLACGQLLRFTDPRRFGAWLWCEDPWQHRLLQHLGVEPLSPAFTGTYLAQAAQGQRMAIKPWLMKSNVVVGIGNIYASEALYQAKISPLCLAGELDQSAINRLVDSIRLILAQAIAQGGSTLRDFRQTNGKLGYFTQQHEVYNRKNQPCRYCTTPIVQLRQGQRSTFYCPSCQRGW
ncbi:MAG: bifunctional DNA-formamidopyrimidine glycosylase/DNA-(apurinic or apyrimidinic site) lyase [Candidatus Symbiodolus clandestinus]